MRVCFVRSCAALAALGLCLAVAACEKDPTGGSAFDAATQDLGGSGGGDGGDGGGATLDGLASLDGQADSGKDSGAGDAGPGQPLLRVFHATHGSAVLVCQDGQQLGPVLDRVTGPSKVVHGYVPLASAAQTSLWVQLSTSGTCSSTAVPESEKLKLTPEAGGVYTAVIKGLSTSHFNKLDDEVTPPTQGLTKIRFYNALEKDYDVCLPGPTALALGVKSHGAASAYIERAPASLDIVLYEVSNDGDCGGKKLGTALIDIKSDTTHTIFLVNNGSSNPPNVAVCDDAKGGNALQPSTCVEKPLSGGGSGT